MSISNRDYVVFKSSEDSRVFKIIKDRSFYYKKVKFAGNDFLGQSYGTQYEVVNGKVVLKPDDDMYAADDGFSLSTECGKDNRSLIGNTNNQKLCSSEIMTMKDKGISGQLMVVTGDEMLACLYQEIVGKIIEHSQTFKGKTEYSQAKYVKKKKAKNLRSDSLSQLLAYINVRSGSTLAVVESSHGLILGSLLERMAGQGNLIHLTHQYHDKSDVLPQFNFTEVLLKPLLRFCLQSLSSLECGTFFDTMSNSQRTLSDVAAIGADGSTTCPIDRDDVSGRGVAIKQSNAEPCPHSETPDNILSIVESAGESTGGLHAESHDLDVTDSRQGTPPTETMDIVDCGGESKGIGAGEGGDDLQLECERRTRGRQCSGETIARRWAGRARREHAAAILKERSLEGITSAERTFLSGDVFAARGGTYVELDVLPFSSHVLTIKRRLVIASKFDPVSLLDRLIPYVAPSRPVVIFCQHLQPLLQCFARIKESRLGLHLKLTETWLRDYQVLPGRTHPKVSISGTGGYLLSFIHVSTQ